MRLDNQDTNSSIAFELTIWSSWGILKILSNAFATIHWQLYKFAAHWKCTFGLSVSSFFSWCIQISLDMIVDANAKSHLHDTITIEMGAELVEQSGKWWLLNGFKIDHQMFIFSN